MWMMKGIDQDLRRGLMGGLGEGLWSWVMGYRFMSHGFMVYGLLVWFTSYGLRGMSYEL